MIPPKKQTYSCQGFGRLLGLPHSLSDCDFGSLYQPRDIQLYTIKGFRSKPRITRVNRRPDLQFTAVGVLSVSQHCNSLESIINLHKHQSVFFQC